MAFPSSITLRLSPGRSAAAIDRKSESAEAGDKPTKASETGVVQIASLLLRLFLIESPSWMATQGKFSLLAFAAKWISTKYLTAFMPILPHEFH